MLIACNGVVVVANVSFRTDDETKAQAAELFRDLGLDMSTAINMFCGSRLPATAFRSRRIAGTRPVPWRELKLSPAPAHRLVVSLS